MNQKTHTGLWAFFQAIEATGQRFIIPTIFTAIQASLSKSEVAASVGMCSFLRSFGYVWGITLPGITVNSQWHRHAHVISDAGEREQMSNGLAYHYAGGNFRHTFPQRVQEEIIQVYANTLKVV
jgi:hypothetical protein